ncbi:MAG: tetratricopeptide repeat protein [Bacteroidales bacterium]|nr:MAG: tetratricopeptide repeat protein [Bacteroidales bacterium]
MIRNKILHTGLAFIVLSLISGCSAEKNTNLSRAYHGLTSHYNIFFNGYESFKKGVKKTDDAFIDDYSKILSLFTYVDEDIAKQLAPEMDRTIQKAYKVITIHSITAKPERKKGEMTEAEEAFYNQPEFNRWIDDSYLLMAKAQFYKHDFHIAVNTLKFVISEALDEKTRKEAYIWLARTNCELGEFREAGRILQFLEDQGPIPEKLMVDFNTTYADFFLKQGEYSEAIPRLTQALSEVRRKKDKYRYTFILAQLHEETGDNGKASDLYRNVIRMNPPYEMTFNSRINMAGSYDASQGNSDEIKKDLKKLLKDKKNIEYQDQIYYAYGNVSFKENKIEEALDYYKKSASASVSNSRQKGKSYLAVADIYFERLEYQPAQTYYDSAVSFLDKEFPDYEKITSKSENLTELVRHINIVELEDSLQMVAGMTDQERYELIDGIIRDINEQERLEREREINQQYNTMSYYENERRFRGDIQREGNWYFYNPTALNFGRNEFRQKWGERKLEDNWRRSNKSTISFESFSGQENMETPAGGNGKPAVADKKSREYYLQNLPVNDSMIVLSDKRIASALYNIGRIYKDDFLDYERAVQSFEDLNRRYPDNEFLLPSFYYLYELNKEKQNLTRENHYRNLIVSGYPDSEYAKIITDPEYFVKIRSEENKVKVLYESAYDAFRRGQYEYVISQSTIADSLFKGDDLLPKFKLLKAMAIGSSQDIRAYKYSLNEVITDYPDSPEKIKAEEIIAFLNKSVPELKEEEEEIQAQEIYTYNDSAVHLFMLVVNRLEIDVNQLIFNIINFNLDNYPQIEYDTQGEMLNDSLQVITVRDFASSTDASEYTRRLIATGNIQDELQNTRFYHFIISEENFATFINDKSVTKYDKFFKNQYLR